MSLFHRSITRQTATVLLALSCLIFALPLQTLGQGAPITITLRPPPPNTLRLSDLWEITIIGYGQPIRDVHLVVSVTDALGQGAQMLTATTSSFTFSGGTTVFSGRGTNLPPTKVTYQSATFRDAIARTGNAPSGSYLVSVDLLPATPAAGPLAHAELPVNVQLVSPPLLLTPVDAAEVSDKYPIFTWTMTGPGAIGARSAAEYAIRIVEIIGRQSPTAAMQSNPAWFEKDKLTTPTLLYPPSARPFNVKSRYAWKVSAVESSGRAAANAQRGALLADSEVWEFTVVPPTLADETQPAAIPKVKKKIDVLEELLRSCAGGGSPVVK